MHTHTHTHPFNGPFSGTTQDYPGELIAERQNQSGFYWSKCCWSPSSSTMMLHCYWVLPVLSWDRMWFRSPKSDAQTLLHLGHRGPVFGFVEAVWRAARRSSELVIQPFTKLLRPVSQTVLYISHAHTHLMALCPGLPVWAGARKVKPIWVLLKQETVSVSGISWAKCKASPHSRQITMPAHHHSVFYRPDALPGAQL